MSRSMYLLCAAAVGLAACGSKEDVTNLANGAANSAADAANSAANAANTTANTATNAADSAESAAKGGGQGYGQPGKPNIKLNVKKVEFRGCTRLIKVTKPNGCMVVKSGSETYDIDSARPLPYPNAAITGTGLYLPNQQGTCMVGKPLTGVKWTYAGGRCDKRKG